MADRNVGTGCGKIGNEAFKALDDAEFGERRCRGWYDEQAQEIVGMFHIECDETEAERISQIVEDAEGSLRGNGASRWPGFWEFEIE
jgi:hypothetical protein